MEKKGGRSEKRKGGREKKKVDPDKKGKFPLAKKREGGDIQEEQGLCATGSRRPGFGEGVERHGTWGRGGP